MIIVFQHYKDSYFLENPLNVIYFGGYFLNIYLDNKIMN
jgi:hypothetical protein